MRTLACLAILAVCCRADQVNDRAAVRETLRQLNSGGDREELFTNDAEGRAELVRLMRGNRGETVRNEPLSHDYWPYWPEYLGKSWPVVVTSIRFNSPDTALADATVRERPIVIVLHKADGRWKIAAVHFHHP